MLYNANANLLLILILTKLCYKNYKAILYLILLYCTVNILDQQIQILAKKYI